MRIYIVQKGDTLGDIAKKHKVELDSIMQLNPQLSGPDYIMPGMKIKIPGEIKKIQDEKKKRHTNEKEVAPIMHSERPMGEKVIMERRRSDTGDDTGKIAMRKPTLGNKGIKQEGKFSAKHQKERPQSQMNYQRNMDLRAEGMHDREEHTYKDVKKANYRPTMMDQQMSDIPPQYLYNQRYPLMNMDYITKGQYGPNIACPCCMYFCNMQQQMYQSNWSGQNRYFNKNHHL